MLLAGRDRWSHSFSYACTGGDLAEACGAHPFDDRYGS
jgi:hypothetical protein